MPVAAGYELHRHGVVVEAAPSEGEKTAIALCYFLSTLEAEDRKIKDLIVVVDDPISSLDTKAMNYACTLVRNRLANAAQLLVLTHNQHCMNEFKKAWKGQAARDVAHHQMRPHKSLSGAHHFSAALQFEQMLDLYLDGASFAAALTAHF